MEITIGVILDELKKHGYVFNIIRIRDYNAIISDFKMVNEGVHERDTDILYVHDIVEKMNLDCMFYIKHIMLFSSTDNTNEIYETLDADTIIAIDGGYASSDILRTLHEIFTYYMRWNEQSLHMILQKKSLNELLNHAASVLTNPIALLDNHMILMATSGEFKNISDGTIWAKLDDPNFSLLDFFTLKEQEELSKHAMRNTGKSYRYYPKKDPTHNYLTAHVRINEHLICNIGLVDVNARFTEGQVYLVEFIRDIIVLYFSVNEHLINMVKNNHQFIEHILSGQDIPNDNIDFYLNRFNWLANDLYCLCYFTTPIKIMTPVEGYSYLRLLNKHFPKSLTVIHKEGIVMISRNRDYSFREGQTANKLQMLCKEHELKCGISSEFQNFIGIRSFIIQAKYASEFCTKQFNNHVCLYELCEMQHIIDSIGKSDDLKGFCHPKLLELWEYGDVHEKDLVKNLYYYLIHGRNLSEAARELFIHRNTLIYRINKLSEYLKTDLQSLDSKELFYYMISCLILINRIEI